MKELDSILEDEEFNMYAFDVKYDKDQFKDPTVIGLLLYRLVQERKRTLYMFKEILQKLDEMNKRLEKLEGSGAPVQKEKEVLSEIDKKIVEYIKTRGKVTAEEIKEAFNYKGTNAACARLNSLYVRGILEKARGGKKVYYWVKG